MFGVMPVLRSKAKARNANWFLNPATAPVVRAYPTAWTHHAAVGGSTGRTFLNTAPDARVMQDGYIRQFQIEVQTLPGGSQNLKFKVFRVNGANYDFVGESEVFTFTGTGVLTYTPAAPILAQMGDVIGYWTASNSNVYTTANTNMASIGYKAGDVSSSDPFTLTLDGDACNVRALGYPPFAAVMGDSIIGGNGDTASPWHTYLQGTGPAGTPSVETLHEIRALLGNGAQLEYQNLTKGSTGIVFASATEMPLCVAVAPLAYILATGVNDVAAAMTWATYLTSLNALAAQLPVGGHLFVCEILPYTGGSDALAAQIRLFNANYVSWCAANGATLVVCHDAMGQNRVSTGQLDDLKAAYDYQGIHLTQAGVDAFAALIQTGLTNFYY